MAIIVYNVWELIFIISNSNHKLQPTFILPIAKL